MDRLGTPHEPVLGARSHLVTAPDSIHRQDDLSPHDVLQVLGPNKSAINTEVGTQGPMQEGSHLRIGFADPPQLEEQE